MVQKLLKPAEFAEKQLLEGILEGRFPQGETLPAERLLAQEMGITRPTLRETLKRLASQGWVSIQHGKPTRVNRYLETGGLSVLRSLARYGKHLPNDMVDHLLEVRTAIFPDIAQKAAHRDPEGLMHKLKESAAIGDAPGHYAEYDWQLQIFMVSASNNPVYQMIFNDFKPLYRVLGKKYFERKNARIETKQYYLDLTRMLEKRDLNIHDRVETMMKKSQTLWETIK